MYEIGKTEGEPRCKRLCFANTSKTYSLKTDFKTYSNRVIKMKVNLPGNDSVSVTNVYAPTSSA